MLEVHPLGHLGPAALADISFSDFLSFLAFYAAVTNDRCAVIAFQELGGLIAASSTSFNSHQFHSLVESLILEF